jgi:2-keto-4-pentenoate hydratase/2-oxohepta-3-ene-1,7-dioic acid hydratase in catechol pathway
MRVARYLAPEASEPAVGIIGDDDIVAEVPASGGDLGPLLLLNKAGLEQVASASMVSHKLSDVRLLAPVGSPGKILALAGNYHPHDSDNPVDVDVNIPKFFAKPTTALLGPDATIPFHAKATIHTVEEIELCVVIGRPGKNISREDAFDHVFGYTVINDFSGRDLRLNPSRDATGQGGWFEWLNGKWLDGYAPVGPWIVPAEDVSDVTNLQITTKVNGAVRVDGNSSRMLYDIPRQIAYISLLCTLEPGDLIATGVVPLAPGIDDEIYIQAGDVIEGVIEGIGTLRNTLGSA